MSQDIVCRNCKQVVGSLANDTDSSEIRMCTECEKESLKLHNIHRRMMNLPVLSWKDLTKWESDMINDFERQMKGLSARRLQEPGKQTVKPVRRLRLE
jgi:hypothetical protein